ncbi:MAG TPA: DUF434 domain-containing protein [Opitutus sp.]|nr:DUF434 domain-containing protein [Opitutus sp.]
MSDTRQHRGAHPEDAEQFSASHRPALEAASADLCWLLDRGYALRSSLALTGDRHGLTQRQRLAVARCACSAAQRARRLAHRLEPSELAGRELWIDGYNLLITLEAALGGGVLLQGRDDGVRDMASLHGTYREVAETRAAAEFVGLATVRWGAAACHWLLDRPVGNSGRLKALLSTLAAEHQWPWDVRLEFSPDKILRETPDPIATTDSVVLDHCGAWCNVAREILRDLHPPPALLVLDGSSLQKT